MTISSVRGAGKARAGATDTTMLIWKVIAARPGITRKQIWERVEHSIPEGYALRIYQRAGLRSVASPCATDLRRARGFVLTNTLNAMRKLGTVAWEGQGEGRQYAVAREPHYLGNTEAIDVTGNKAAEHLAVADALRTMKRAVAKVNPERRGRPGAALPLSWKEYEALLIMIKALDAN